MQPAFAARDRPGLEHVSVQRAQGAQCCPKAADLTFVSSSFLHHYIPMITYKMQNSEIFWHGLLNCSEARVLSPVEERKLLVELVDCKQRILAGLDPA